MDLTIHKPTFFKNLKFWSFHSTINAIPSFCIAYIHDWDTLESILAMGIGIILFTLMWSFLISMRDVDQLCNSPFISSAITTGIYLRLTLIILTSPLIIGFIVYLLSGEQGVYYFTDLTGQLWVGDFIIGMISHGFYSIFRDIIPISGVHDFLPTIVITLTQGFLLMLGMLIAGIIIAIPSKMIGTHRNQRRAAQI